MSGKTHIKVNPDRKGSPGEPKDAQMDPTAAPTTVFFVKHVFLQKWTPRERSRRHPVWILLTLAARIFFVKNVFQFVQFSVFNFFQFQLSATQRSS